MLSAREFVAHADAGRRRPDIDRQELDTLLERQLVAMERLAGGAMLPRVTEDGDSLLRAVRRTY